MKIAIGIIALMFGLLVFMQSCTVGAGSHIIGDQALSQAGSLGIIVAFLMFIGGAFAFGLPLVAGIILAVAALIAFAGAGSFTDLSIWGFLCAALSGLSLLAWRSGRKQARANIAVAPEAINKSANQ